MTELLEEALSRLRERPAADQDIAAEAIFAFVERDEPAYRLTPEQVDEVRRTLEGVRNGSIRVATEEEVEAMWRRFGV